MTLVRELFIIFIVEPVSTLHFVTDHFTSNFTPNIVNCEFLKACLVAFEFSSILCELDARPYLASVSH